MKDADDAGVRYLGLAHLNKAWHDWNFCPAGPRWILPWLAKVAKKIPKCCNKMQWVQVIQDFHPVSTYFLDWRSRIYNLWFRVTNFHHPQKKRAPADLDPEASGSVGNIPSRKLKTMAADNLAEGPKMDRGSFPKHPCFFRAWKLLVSGRVVFLKGKNWWKKNRNPSLIFGV